MVSRQKNPYLLDANVLLALAWPQHAHHAQAHAWFRHVGHSAWATCAITQLAFVRISANPRLTVEGVTPHVAASLLEQMTQLPGHHYLQDLPAMNRMPLFQATLLLGHRQVTDLYLLALAQHHQVRLATFDQGIPQLLSNEAERHRWIELLG